MINGTDWLKYFERVLESCGDDGVVKAALQCQVRYPSEADDIARSLPYPWRPDGGCYMNGDHLKYVRQVTGKY